MRIVRCLTAIANNAPRTIVMKSKIRMFSKALQVLSSLISQKNGTPAFKRSLQVKNMIMKNQNKCLKSQGMTNTKITQSKKLLMILSLSKLLCLTIRLIFSWRGTKSFRHLILDLLRPILLIRNKVKSNVKFKTLF